jgi:hypothetical protein
MTEAVSVFQAPPAHGGSNGPATAVFHATPGRALAIALLGVLVTLLARVLLIAVFGSSLPFWDQWGAEGAALYQPLVENRYDWHSLWTAHNEHRIALTRLFAIALFAANDYQWDVRVQLLANSLVFALSLGVLVYYLQRHVPRRISNRLCAVVFLIGVVPFAWENTIAGFQNGFYFLFLATVLMLRVAAHCRATPGTFLLLAALSILTLSTIATGILTLLACAGVLALRVLGRENSLRGVLPLLLVVTGALAVALLTFVRIDHHELLAAQGIVGHLWAAAITTSWPLLPPATVLFAAPLLAFAWRFLRERRYDPVDGFFAGLFMWAALLCLATAHSRGYGLRLVPSRYTDLFALGSLAYVYFALRMRDRWPAWNGFGRAAALATPALVALGMVAQSVIFWPFMQDRRFLTRIETVNVRAFLEGETGALSNKPPFYIPVPDGAPLAQAFDNPVFRQMVPVSIAAAGSATALPPRPCRWQPISSAPAADGAVDCAPSEPAATSAVPLGRLSAWSFRLWQLLYTDTFPVLRTAGKVDALPPSEGVCAIDAVNLDKPQTATVFRVYYPSVIRFSGWVGSTQASGRQAPMTISMLADDGALFSASTDQRVQRADVAAAYSNPSLAWSGFDTAVTADVLPQGRYRILLAAEIGKHCDTGHFVDVAHSADERLNY